MGCSDLLPLFVMVIVQLGYAGVNIVATAVMGAGMNPFIHIAYQQMFATIALAPLAYFLERKSRPKMTPNIFFQIFLTATFGLTGDQIAYFVGLNNSTPTVASALANLIPAITFVAAVLFRLESVGLRTKGGQAKILGTLICIGGAMLLTLYMGPVVIGQSTIHWKYAKNTVDKNSSSSHGNVILGPIMVILSCCSYSAFLITQARLSKQYGAPYSSTALACFLAIFECLIIALCVDHNVSDWTLTPMRAVSTTYNGLVYSALAICLTSWCIERKGPLYVAVFNPLLLVLTAILSWAFLREKIYTGTVMGSILIVVGLYIVLWGKKNELQVINVEDNNKLKEKDAEKTEAGEC
ncbi:PREDICTED: WAT1-related protein At1g09380-like [Ipomoea nil]|uniref:WAT1-related protein At1g09380-like n=1 Tax=Ipomoea nil TaxID=35883 RepID=UPI000900B18B|nr:PREDICTED: WAT1-related protein At1g09380-like [Ipomoea nil]